MSAVEAGGAIVERVTDGMPRKLAETAAEGLPGRLYTVEPTGDITFVHVQLGSAFLVASTTESFRGTPDQPVRVELDQQHLYLFDRETQQAL